MRVSEFTLWEQEQGQLELDVERTQMSEFQDLIRFTPVDYILHLVCEHKHEMSMDCRKCFPGVQEIILDSFGKWS